MAEDISLPIVTDASQWVALDFYPPIEHFLHSEWRLMFAFCVNSPEYVVWTSRHILDFPLFPCHFISHFKAFSLHNFPSETSQDLPDPQAWDEGKHLFLSFSLLRRPFVAKEEESVSTQHLNTTRYCFLSVSCLFPVSFLSCEWSAWMMRYPLTCVSQLWWFCFFVFTWTIFFFFFTNKI